MIEESLSQKFILKNIIKQEIVSLKKQRKINWSIRRRKRFVYLLPYFL